MAWKQRPTRLPAPFLRRLTLDPARVEKWEDYPFSLPLFSDHAFELAFDRPVTIIVGENGVGKSTLLEGVAALAGFDEAGGGKGYRPVDHSRAIDRSGGALARALRPQWLPRVTAAGSSAPRVSSRSRAISTRRRSAWARRRTFFPTRTAKDFLRFFDERTRRQGFFIFDEPELALSPSRQIEFMKLLRRMEKQHDCQAIIATHSPLLMAYPGAALLRMTPSGMARIDVTQTDHFRLLKEFFIDPRGFVETMLEG